jgi:hypothetical protein
MLQMPRLPEKPTAFLAKEASQKFKNSLIWGNVIELPAIFRHLIHLS